jgi:hypothetical protein
VRLRQFVGAKDFSLTKFYNAWLQFVLQDQCHESLNFNPLISGTSQRSLLKPITITNINVIDLRFPTSREHIGSDAVNKDPDYSAAYCLLETDAGTEGHGLTFTLGRGTELCVSALRYLAKVVTPSFTRPTSPSSAPTPYQQNRIDSHTSNPKRWLRPQLLSTAGQELKINTSATKYWGTESSHNRVSRYRS